MPPKAKIKKEDILRTAFELVREKGTDSLNARNIAHELRCSTQPVFSYYINMEDLKTDVFNMVTQFHSEYINKVEIDENFFMNIGMTYIDFAVEEPNLFRMLFMSDGFSGRKLTEVVSTDCNERTGWGFPKTIDRNSDQSNKIFVDMWMYAHGIASMLAANQLPMERSEIEAMVENMFHLLTDGIKKNDGGKS